MRIRSLAVLLSFALLPSARAGDEFKKASPEELAMKSVAMAPGAPAVVLDWLQASDDSKSLRTSYMRIKILTEEGKKYGDISIPYIPRTVDLKHVRARTTRPDGTIVPFSGKTYEKVLVKVGGVRLVARTFTMPDVQPGSIIEYRYDLAFRGNIIFDTNFVVQGDLPVLHETLWLRPHPRFASFFQYKDLPEGKKPEKVKDHFELELTNVPAFESEPFAPPESFIKPQVNFFYTTRTIEPGAFWDAEANDWAAIIEPFIGDRAEVRRVAAETTAGTAASEEKVRKLYARAQQIRNLSFEPDKTEQEQKKLRDNRNVEDVLRNGYGWNNEITRSFVALARAAGFEANVARVAERDELFFALNVPVGSQLSGEVAAVVVDGKLRFLDPGTPYAPFGIVSWQKTNVSGLLVAPKQAAATWVTTTEEPPESAVLRRTADLRFDSGVLRGSIAVEYRGQQALQKRFELRNDDEEGSRKSFEESIKSWLPDGTTVKVTTIKNLRDTEPPLAVEADVELPALGSNVGSRVMLPLSIFAASQKNVFVSESRKNAIYFHYHYTIEDKVTLKLPPGFDVEALPTGANIDMGALRYTRTVDKGGDAVRFNRKVRVALGFAGQDQYKNIRRFFSQLAAADQEQVVLRKAAAVGR